MISTPPFPAPAGTRAALRSPGRQWRIATTTGPTVTGYLPAWAATDPSEADVPVERLGVRLSNISHYAEFEGQTACVLTADRNGQAADEQVLFGSIDCHPYAEDPDSRVPTVNINITADCWIADLDPDGLVKFSAKLRAQADRFDNEVLPALIAAREDWNVHHSPGEKEPTG